MQFSTALYHKGLYHSQHKNHRKKCEHDINVFTIKTYSQRNTSNYYGSAALLHLPSPATPIGRVEGPRHAGGSPYTYFKQYKLNVL